jgi:hypothetical protein
VFNALKYADGRRYKAAYAASCTQQSLSLKLKWSYKPSTMTIPCMLTAGTGPFDNNTIAPLASLRENLNGMPDSVPAVIARRSGKDHGDMLTEGDAYMTAWFCCWLKGDTSARGAFSEHGGEIRRNPRWQDVTVRNIR